MEAPGEEIKKEIEEQIREESKASAFAKWVHRHSRAIFSLLAIVFIFSVFFIFNTEYTVAGLGALASAIGQVHKALSAKRFSTYQLVFLLMFLSFMAILVVESAKARSIIIVPARNPERQIYVRVKPLIGVKLPFLPESKKIKPSIYETEYGYIVYPSKGLLNARWNGEKHFIPKHCKLSYGNIWIIAGYPGEEPTRVEKVKTAQGDVEIDVYEWTVDNLGNILAEKAQKEIETLRKTHEIIEKQLEHAWKLAKKIVTEPEEFFDKIRKKAKDDVLDTIDVVGSTVFREITATIRQAYKYAQAARKREKDVPVTEDEGA